jgi:hypothetical protein
MYKLQSTPTPTTRRTAGSSKSKFCFPHAPYNKLGFLPGRHLCFIQIITEARHNYFNANLPTSLFAKHEILKYLSFKIYSFKI